MRKLLCLLLALLIPAAAAFGVGAQEQVIGIGGETYYDTREGKFLYYAGQAGAVSVYCTAADGMITGQPVTVSSEVASALEIYRDGTRLEGTAVGTFQQPGEYVIMYIGGQVAQRVLSFTVIPQVSNRLQSYSLPQGFVFTSVTLEGEPVAFSRNYVKLTGEGLYDIRYLCSRTGIGYQLTFRADHTGPTLALEAVENGVARGPVDISDAKQAASVTVYRDGEKISRKDVLTESGEYRIELADEAGNQTVYNFTILIYFDGNSWLFFLILLLSVLGIGIYLIHTRKHLRVR